FPTHGWMVSDGSAGNGMSESGKFAYYFGTVPNLNWRYACMRGNTFNMGDIHTSWLQGPSGPVVQGTASIASIDGPTALVQVTQAEAESLAQAHTSHVMQLHVDAARRRPTIHLPTSIATEAARARVDAVTACPCHLHGGFVRRAAAAGAPHAASRL